MSDVCSTCWFANGDGESAHCGKCRCCSAGPNDRALAATAAATVSVLTRHTGGCTCQECETLAYIRLPEVVEALTEDRRKGREEVLQALRNFTVAQELEALAELSPNCRRHMMRTIDLLRALIEVEEVKP